MIHFVLGGPNSGKSSLAEDLAVKAVTGEKKHLYYIATMRTYDEDGEKRIARHRQMRDGKGFETIEQFTDLNSLNLEFTGEDTVVLLECLTNLVGNELFEVGGSDDEIRKRIADGIIHLQKQTPHLIIVSSMLPVGSQEASVGGNGSENASSQEYNQETKHYLELLNTVNEDVKMMADHVTEMQVISQDGDAKKPISETTNEASNESINNPASNKGLDGIIGSLFGAFAMYSAIPAPQVSWRNKVMKNIMCFFPMVGVAIGLVLRLFFFVAEKLSMNLLAFSCIGTVLPILITGGIHMDGLLDVIDAKSSHQSREKKLEILKDPHVGAFAIIGCGVYLLLYLAVFSTLRRNVFLPVCAVFVLSRALSGWAVVSFPKAKKDGLVSSFSAGAEKNHVQIAMGIWLVLAIAYMVMVSDPLMAAGALAVGLLCLGWYRHMALKEFGGITGDLAGYFLQICELVMILTLSIISRCV